MATARPDLLFPEMDSSSAAFPTIRIIGEALHLAYYLPGCADSAVVTFKGVVSWNYDGPNDEGLNTHPLWAHGLDFYTFHEVIPGPEEGKRQWIATFHEAAFEVVATGTPEVRASLLKHCSPVEALDKVLGSGDSKVLDEVA
jgi:hypothetical protein